jgi:hypothetical protein
MGTGIMRSLGIVTIMSVVATAAAPASSPSRLVTEKTSHAFADCFVRSQEMRAAAWAYVPKADGGTFSNLGAPSVARPYFLVVSDRGSHREIVIEGAGRKSTAFEGANQCI